MNAIDVLLFGFQVSFQDFRAGFCSLNNCCSVPVYVEHNSVLLTAVDHTGRHHCVSEHKSHKYIFDKNDMF